jgi:hypothetical protein
MTLYKLGLEIADEGGWETFHQRRHNYTMYDHHKARRLRLEAEYRERKAHDNQGRHGCDASSHHC